MGFINKVHLKAARTIFFNFKSCLNDTHEKSIREDKDLKESLIYPWISHRMSVTNFPYKTLQTQGTQSTSNFRYGFTDTGEKIKNRIAN